MVIFCVCYMDTGAGLRFRDITGMRALEYAQFRGQPQIAALLKAAGDLRYTIHLEKRRK